MAVTSTYGDGNLLVRTYSKDKKVTVPKDENMLVNKQARAAGQKAGLAKLEEKKA